MFGVVPKKAPKPSTPKATITKKYTGKGTRARLNTAASKMLFSQKSK